MRSEVLNASPYNTAWVNNTGFDVESFAGVGTIHIQRHDFLRPMV